MGRRTRRGGARDNKHAGGGYIEREQPDLEDLIERSSLPLFLVLDGVQDPHNLGACMRSADGAGVTAVIAPRKRAVGITDTVARISCGASESVPFLRVTNITNALRKMQEAGICVVGTADAERSRSLYDVDLSQPLAIVMGSEESGIRRLIQDTCDVVVSLPMRGKVDCLNVSVATGVCLYEALRQRIAAGKI